MKLAILGCGYVANMYRLTLPMHPELELVGVFDKERSRSENMARLTESICYSDIEAMLNDKTVELVLNFTNPQAHYETTLACLKADKHVYTEKPLAMNLDHAQALVKFAKKRRLMLSSAPCTLMNDVAQTLWKAVKDKVVGEVRLVYAEMEDGMVSHAPVSTWVNEAGTAWPTVNEFETGCAIEHAGYVMSWLVAIFGPAESVTAFSDILIKNKIPSQAIAPAADFSVGCIKFVNGVVVRMTNGIYAEHDHQLRIFGDQGVLNVKDPRSDDSSIGLKKYHTIRRKRFLSPLSKKLKLCSSPGQKKITKYRGSQTRDFCRAIADMALAKKEGREPYLGADFSLHITELTLACQFASDLAEQGKMPYKMTTTFDAMEPLAWAK